VQVWGGIEAGGTKFVCAVGSGPGGLLLDRQEFATAQLDRTLTPILAFFRRFMPLQGVGIAAFGPLDLHTESPTYGWITSSPKAEWRDFDFVGTVRTALGVPVAFDTDVNSAALGEYRWGAARGLDTFLYLTVGTGIGGGAIVNGRLLHGLVHPEMGHLRVPHDWEADPFPGSCAFHGDCWEGLASGPRGVGAGSGIPGPRPDHPRPYTVTCAGHRKRRRAAAARPAGAGAPPRSRTVRRLRPASGDHAGHCRVYRPSGVGRRRGRAWSYRVGAAGLTRAW
jgi:predicted NBD/HSP70 family sugar kinase